MFFLSNKATSQGQFPGLTSTPLTIKLVPSATTPQFFFKLGRFITSCDETDETDKTRKIDNVLKKIIASLSPSANDSQLIDERLSIEMKKKIESVHNLFSPCSQLLLRGNYLLI